MTRLPRQTPLSLDEIAEQTGVAADELRAFYALFARTEKVVTVYSQGVNQSSAGTDKVNAIINCHLATGRIGRPGMGPFSVTGQPNAMGGREVGGLANMLAAHMEIENPEHRDRVQRFWRAPTMAERPGLKAVEMFRAVADGRIKAIWIMGTNPVVSMPDADFIEAALKACPLRRRLRCCCRDRHAALRACQTARRGLGRERRDRHQFRTADFTPAAFSAAARRGAARLGDHLRRRAAHGLCRSLFFQIRRGNFRRICRAFSV